MAQVEAGLLRGADLSCTQLETEVRAAADHPAVTRNCVEPAEWAPQKRRRRHQHATMAREDREQEVADQAHVVEHRQPAYDYTSRINTQRLMYRGFVGK